MLSTREEPSPLQPLRSLYVEKLLELLAGPEGVMVLFCGLFPHPQLQMFHSWVLYANKELGDVLSPAGPTKQSFICILKGEIPEQNVLLLFHSPLVGRKHSFAIDAPWIIHWKCVAGFASHLQEADISFWFTVVIRVISRPLKISICQSQSVLGSTWNRTGVQGGHWPYISSPRAGFVLGGSLSYCHALSIVKGNNRQPIQCNMVCWAFLSLNPCIVPFTELV